MPGDRRAGPAPAGRATIGRRPPPARPSVYLDHPGPIPLVHRAAGGEHPENTLPAILAVLALGFRYVETDARTTSDGVAVLAHDADLRRVAGHRVRVADLTTRDLEAVPLGPAGALGPSVVPRLDDVLGACPGLRLNIDLKDAGAVRAVADALARTGAGDRVCVTSFSDRRVDAFRQLVGPQVCTGMGVRRSAALWSSARVASGRLSSGRASSARLPLAARLLARATAPAAVAQLPLRMAGVPVLDRRLVAHAHALGLPVHAWTVDERPTMRRLLDDGVDGIVTNAPLLLRSVLAERGLWFP